VTFDFSQTTPAVSEPEVNPVTVTSALPVSSGDEFVTVIVARPAASVKITTGSAVAAGVTLPER